MFPRTSNDTVLEVETTKPTKHLGGQLMRTHQGPRAGKSSNIVYHCLITKSHTAYPIYSPQCLNKGGPGARCGKVNDSSYDFPMSGVGTPL